MSQDHAERTPSRPKPGQLLAHVAGWPQACIHCGQTVRKGEAMVYRNGEKVRWCMTDARLLQAPITATRAYLDAFGEDENLQALTHRPKPAEAPADEEHWREQIRDVRKLKGRRVRVRAGARIVGSTNPNHEFGETTKRAQVVTVDHVLSVKGTPGTREYRQAAVRWRSGHYVRGVSVDDITEVL